MNIKNILVIIFEKKPEWHYNREQYNLKSNKWKFPIEW
jgi:hypothetical protein